MTFSTASPIGVFASLILLGCNGSSGPGLDGHAKNLQEFEERIEILRDRLKIPGLGVGISSGNQIVWSRGLGFADIEGKVAAKPSTEFHIASLTKGFAGVILVKLVSEGVISLDDPVSKFGVSIPGGAGITVRHLANMTSEGTPGRTFAYNGDRFGLLEQVIISATGKSFGELAVNQILKPLALQQTAPNIGSSSFDITGLDRAAFTVNLAIGYGASGSSFNRTAYPTHFGPAAGMISSAEDMLRFSMAIDSDQLLTASQRSMMFEAAKDPSGVSLPYAIGWFSQTIQGVPVQWAYGYWIANSSLIIRVPSKQLAFIALANSDRLSADFSLGSGDLLSSPVAQEFLEAFVFGNAELR
jgi:CubicO group peptidase (beta-lactamase class C family)